MFYFSEVTQEDTEIYKLQVIKRMIFLYSMEFFYNRNLEELPMVHQICGKFGRGWLVKSEEMVF